MKKAVLLVAAASFALSLPLASIAADHQPMNMNHGTMNMEHGGMMSMGKLAYEGVVNGVKATFNVIDIKEKMAQMGMKETNHIMVMFTDAKTGKMMSDGEAKIKVVGPDRKAQIKKLMGMEGGFGADFTMPKAGKYAVMAKFKPAGGKVRTFKFWYTVK